MARGVSPLGAVAPFHHGSEVAATARFTVDSSSDRRDRPVGSVLLRRAIVEAEEYPLEKACKIFLLAW